MNDPYLMSNYPKPPTREPERPEGVQGPERHLVEDVAQRIPQQGDVEAPQEGRRGVEEIGGAVELREYVERNIREARERERVAELAEDDEEEWYELGYAHALEDLLKLLPVTDSQRSDLFNASVEAREKQL